MLPTQTYVLLNGSALRKWDPVSPVVRSASRAQFVQALARVYSVLISRLAMQRKAYRYLALSSASESPQLSSRATACRRRFIVGTTQSIFVQRPAYCVWELVGGAVLRSSPQAP
jgi:hypothetical protein